MYYEVINQNFMERMRCSILKQVEYNLNNILEKEAQDYFSHNPKAKSVAFILLEADKLEELENEGSVEIIDGMDCSLVKVIENDNLESE